MRATLLPQQLTAGLAPRAARPAARSRSMRVEAQLKAPVTFTLSGKQIGAGESVRVIGGSSELGKWEPGNAPALSAAGDSLSATVLVPLGEPVEFKFVITGGAGPQWEGCDNRIITADGPQAIWTSWDSTEFSVGATEGQVVFMEDVPEIENPIVRDVYHRLRAHIKQLVDEGLAGK